MGRHRAALLGRARAAPRRRAGIRSAAAARACGRAWAAASRCCRPGSARRSSAALDDGRRRSSSPVGDDALDRHRRRPRRSRPGIEPIAQDELTTGAQVALARAVRADGVGRRAAGCAAASRPTAQGFDNPGRSTAACRRPRDRRWSPPRSRPRRPRSSCCASATRTRTRSARGPARSIRARARCCTPAPTSTPRRATSSARYRPTSGTALYIEA